MNSSFSMYEKGKTLHLLLDYIWWCCDQSGQRNGIVKTLISLVNKSCFLKELWCNDITKHNYKGACVWLGEKLMKQVKKTLSMRRFYDAGWCTKHKNKILLKLDRENEMGLYLAQLCSKIKYRPISFSRSNFSKILFPCFLHHHCLSVLYATNPLRECFYWLVNICSRGQCDTKRECEYLLKRERGRERGLSPNVKAV